MVAKKRITEFLYYFIMATITTFAIAANSLAATVLDTDTKGIIFFTLLFITAFYIVFFNKYTVIVMLSGSFLAGIILLIYLWQNNFEVEWFIKIKDYINEVFLFIMNSAPYHESYNKVLEILVVFLVSLVVSSTIRNWAGFYAITVLGVITLAVPAINNWNHSVIGRYLFIFSFVVLLLEKLNFMVTEDKSENGKMNFGYALLSVPLSALVLIGSLFAPIMDVTGYSVINELNSAGRTILNEATSKSTVFSEGRKKLGGPLVLGDEPVMEVDADERLYLSGMFMDTYTGSEWYIKDPDIIKKEISTESDGSYNIDLYSLEEKAKQNTYMNELGYAKKEVKIYPEKEIKTKRIYTAPFSSHLNIEVIGENKVVTSNESFWVKKQWEDDSVYTETYISWDYDSKQFQTLLNEGLNDGITDPDYLEKYLQLPEKLPQRVKDLAEEITTNANGDYAKLRAIEDYLRTNYPYTLETEELPKGSDFVDHFLFVEKQGYCVYYATAMVVMARTQGIPTRYVEGFAMPPTRNERGNYSVTNQQAHAWVEAYFPEFGWVRFEPTASLAAPEISIPLEKKEEEPIVPDIEEEPKIEAETDSDTDVVPDVETELTDVKPIPIEEDKKFPPILKGLLITLAIIGLFAIVIKYMIGYYRKKFEKIERLSNREKAVEYFGYTLKVVKAMGYPIKINETVIEYADRVSGVIEYNEIIELAEIYSKAQYSKEEIINVESEEVKKGYYTLLERLRKEQDDQLKFAIDRYILMRY